MKNLINILNIKHTVHEYVCVFYIQAIHSLICLFVLCYVFLATESKETVSPINFVQAPFGGFGRIRIRRNQRKVEGKVVYSHYKTKVLYTSQVVQYCLLPAVSLSVGLYQGNLLHQQSMEMET